MAKSTTPSSSSDDLAAALLSGPPQSESKCHTSLILKRLREDRPEAAQALEQALAMTPTQYPSTAIARRLSQFGYEVSNTSVQRHRRGECRCRQTEMN